MSPRHNRRRRDVEGVDEERARRPIEAVQARDGDWMVRTILGEAAVKTYRCPGCNQDIKPGVPHVVAWPADERGDAGDRRHWHTGCWNARGRRSPTVQRSSRAPRYG
jgi:hypothetical protein